MTEPNTDSNANYFLKPLSADRTDKMLWLKVDCSQTLYFLFKVRRVRVVKYKLQGLYWPPAQVLPSQSFGHDHICGEALKH